MPSRVPRLEYPPVPDPFCGPDFGKTVSGRWLRRTPAPLCPRFVVAIPARNEAERILPCLEACRDALAAASVAGRLLVLVNNSTDETARLVLHWAEEHAAPLDLAEIWLPAQSARAGAARRLAFALGRRVLPADGVLMTTDADSRPDPLWAVANLAGIERGAALVCGRIDLDPEELAALPPACAQRQEVETRYRRAALELQSLLDPDRFNPWPHHGLASGASLALSAAAHDRIGGLPAAPVAEDRALAALLTEHDLPVLYCDKPRVVTSCRLVGRAAGGMADTLAHRLAEEDYWCDETVEPAEILVLRAESRAAARRLHARGEETGALLERLGLPPGEIEIGAASFGAWWQRVERASPLLRRKRMRASQAAAQLPLLLRALDTARGPAPAAALLATGTL